MRIIIAATLVFFPAISSAQSLVDSTRQHQTCMSRATSMVDSRQCDTEEIERQKALLNAEYDIVTQGIDQSAKDSLDKAQKAWVTFRNLDCQAKVAAFTGSGGADAYNQCMLEHIKIRKYQLEKFFLL